MPLNAQHTAAAPVRSQAGIALMETLVALVVLALGLLGLVAAQTRLAAESRSSAQRAVAVGLIDDLGNRMLINREAALLGRYDMAWGATPSTVNCTTANCTADQRAKYDLHQWMQALQASLPAGTATVFRSTTDPRQIGVAVSWAAREGGASADDRAARLALLSSGFQANSGGVSCPAGSYCQLVYVQP
jgi:type IV pilus assembly protein PilV